MTIGILSFQGDYYLHRKILNYMNVKSVYVNSRESLLKTDALIIPGGESTVISQFLIQTNLDKEIFIDGSLGLEKAPLKTIIKILKETYSSSIGVDRVSQFSYSLK